MLLACLLLGGAVKNIAPIQLTVTTAAGSGIIPMYLSADWTGALPEITRAIVVIHGRNRNADTYFATARAAVAAAGATGILVIAPQFLDDDDIAAYRAPDTWLRWSTNSWMAGDPAHGRLKLSSFDALDAILARLSDRARFPHLTQIVIAGHSGGGQVTQRYAVLGRGEQLLAAGGVKLRYVVANPSSYAWFSGDRPVPAANCPPVDAWKYGLQNLPPYAAGTDPASLERRYVSRDIRYLLGGADSDPTLRVLDKTCSAEAQGADHLARGENFFAYLRARHPDLTQTLAVVPGVGHDGRAMLTSAAGLDDLFH